jgi:small-conductance mechanosensitive channel
MDIAASWKVLIISSITALIFGYLYLFVIRLLGGLIIWVSIVIIQLSLLAGGIYTIMYRDQKFDSEEKTYTYMSWAAYLFFILFAVVFVLVCCFWHAIKIGIAVFKTTS